MMAAESSQTLERGLRLLRLLADGHRGRTPTELAESSDLSRPAVYRLLTTLQEEGFVRRSGNGRVHLGFGVLSLAQAVHPLLRAAALPTLRRLAEQVGATAHLTVAEGDEGLAVAVVEPSWTNSTWRIGRGRGTRSGRGPAGLAILGLRRGGTGYLVTEGQLQEGARGIAAPLAGLPGLEASVGVVTFSALDPGTIGPRVAGAAAELARSLT